MPLLTKRYIMAIFISSILITSELWLNILLLLSFCPCRPRELCSTSWAAMTSLYRKLVAKTHTLVYDHTWTPLPRRSIHSVDIPFLKLIDCTLSISHLTSPHPPISWLDLNHHFFISSSTPQLTSCLLNLPFTPLSLLILLLFLQD